MMAGPEKRNSNLQMGACSIALCFCCPRVFSFSSCLTFKQFPKEFTYFLFCSYQSLFAFRCNMINPAVVTGCFFSLGSEIAPLLHPMKDGIDRTRGKLVTMPPYLLDNFKHDAR